MPIEFVRVVGLTMSIGFLVACASEPVDERTVASNTPMPMKPPADQSPPTGFDTDPAPQMPLEEEQLGQPAADDELPIEEQGEPERPAEPLDPSPNEHVTSRDAEFEWTGVIDHRDTVILRNVQGTIRVRPSSDGRIRINTSKTAGDSPIDSVEIEVHKHSRGVTLCTVYKNGIGGQVNQCRPDGSGQLNAYNNDVQVSVEVEIPAGPVVIGQTAAGNLTTEMLANFVDFQSIHGSLSIRTTEPALATSTSGTIDVTMDPSNIAEYGLNELFFETTSGGVTVRVPEDSNLDVEARTTAGRVQTDFNLNGEGTGQVAGRVNNGGVRLVLETVSGGINLTAQ